MTYKPRKLNEQNRKYASRRKIPGFFFEPLAERKVNEYESRKIDRDDTGYISPSNRINLTMCMDEYFEEVFQVPSTFDIGGLYIMDEGSNAHRSIGWEARHCSGLLWPEEPRLSEDLMNWYLRAKEVPISCDLTGFRGKIDHIISVNGAPGVLDYKTCYPDDWRTFLKERLPKADNIAQVAVYANRLNKAKTFSVPVQYIGLAYQCRTINPSLHHGRAEMWWNYDKEFDWYAQVFVYNCGLHRIAKLFEKKRRRCQYDFCYRHGDASEMKEMIQSKRFI